MKVHSKPRVKICCISSIAEAELAVSYGASALGLVSEMPSGPGVIPEELIALIAGSVPPTVSTFLLTSRRRPADIAEQVTRCGTDTVQICDRLEGSHGDLRRMLPRTRIVQVVHVSGPDSVEEAEDVARHSDALLLDSGDQSLEVKKLGGTGRTHNWSLSREIVERVDVPVFLAGGLNPTNVRAAIEAVRPFGLDLCTGVRTEGLLDESKLSAFFASI